MNEPTHLDLFSGIGGFALAARWAGFRTIGFCEIDKYCQKVLAKNFLADASQSRGRSRRESNGERQETSYRSPQIYGDIFDLDGRQFAGVDLITGGFPCQPFSVAGKRRGAADDRAIWPEMFRVISEARPTWVLGENVPGIIAMELDNVLSDLERIGYATRSFVIPACAVDARHRRDRLWVVGRFMGNSAIEGLSDGRGAPMAERGGTKQEPKRSSGQSGRLQNISEASELRLERSAQAGNDRSGWPEPVNEFSLRLHRSHSPNGGGEALWLPEPDVGGTFDGLSRWLDGRGEINEKNLGRRDELCALWDAILTEAIQWSIRGFISVSPQTVLFALLCKHEKWQIDEARLLMEGEKALKTQLRGLWFASQSYCPSCGSKHSKQQSREHSDALQTMSRLLARYAEKVWISYRRENAGTLGWETGFSRVAHGVPSRVDRLKGLGNAIVPQVAYEILREIRKLI